MGLLGLVLAMIGVYGVVSYGATQRTREIGIRMALGALPGDVVSLILRQGLVLVGAGMAAGVVIAVPLRRALGGLLFLTRDTPPLVFLAVTLALAAVALAARYLPAHRAMRIDPMVALRHE